MKSKAYKLFHKGTLALSRAEQQGMRIDVTYCKRKKKSLTRKIERLQNKFLKTKLAKDWQQQFKDKTNIYSPLQLSKMLYEVKKLTPVKLTAKEKGSTDDEALKALNLPEINILLEIRKLKKLRDTYLDAFSKEQVDGIIHPSFNLHTVTTFRSSSQNPNFQNIPRRDIEAMNTCRKAILPRPGHQLVEIDYEGIEVKVSCCYHKDPTMLKYINDPKSDMHLDMAKQIFMLDFMDKKIPEHKVIRNATKNGFVFPQFYGDYYANCAKNIACGWCNLSQGKWKKGQGITMPEGNISDHLISVGIKSFQQFTDHIKKIEDSFWNERFPVYKKWKEKLWRDYQRKGYVDMLTGFRCKGVMTKNEVLNRPIQGSAFHCLLWSFIELDKIMRKENWESRLIGQIHDAIVFDIYPNELEHVIETTKYIACEKIRKAWDWIIVPLNVDVEICSVDRPWNEKGK